MVARQTAYNERKGMNPEKAVWLIFVETYYRKIFLCLDLDLNDSLNWILHFQVNWLL